MRHPTDNPLRAFVLLLIGALLTVIAIQYGNDLDARESDVEACNRGNVNRASDHASAVQDQRDARELAGQESDPEIAGIWRRRAAGKKDLAEGIVEAAARSGSQTAPAQPTIVCEDVIEDVSLSPFS